MNSHCYFVASAVVSVNECFSTSTEAILIENEHFVFTFFPFIFENPIEACALRDLLSQKLNDENVTCFACYFSVFFLNCHRFRQTNNKR